MQQRAITFALLLFVTSSSHASKLMLNGQQIQQHLADHTALYESGEKQFFNARGSTIYVNKSGGYEHGQWKVTGDKYCSHWARGGWSCYKIAKEGDTFTFLAPFSAGKDWRAVLIPGSQL